MCFDKLVTDLCGYINVLKGRNIMRKNMVSVWAKRALAVALSFALITPISIADLNSIVTEAYEYEIEVPAPVAELDFEKGFKGEAEYKFEVAASEPVLNYNCVETPVGETGTIYEYDYTSPLYQGTAADADYKKTSTANTPSSEYDEAMGHVILMHKTYTVGEFIKTTPAAYTNETTGELLTDINARLDEMYPPYAPVLDENEVETEESLKAKEKATLQKEYTYYPEAKLVNPLLEKDLSETPLTNQAGAPVWTKGVTFNYWVKLTPNAVDPTVSDNTVVLNIKKTGTLQYPQAPLNQPLYPFDMESTFPYGFGNGCLQISADGSVIFTEDDGTIIDKNEKSETFGQPIDCNSDNYLTIAGSSKVLTDICKPEEWHMVTINVTNDSITTYYDGVLFEEEKVVSAGPAFNTGFGYGGTATPSENQANPELSKSSLLLDWLASADTVSIGGCNEAVTNSVEFDAYVSPFSLDDLRIYDQMLTAVQVQELYNEGQAKMAKLADKEAELPEGTVITFDSADDFSTDIKTNTKTKNDKIALPELTKDVRMGSVVKTYAGRSDETSAAKVASNPFAGKELTGATVSYWMKADSKVVEEKRGETITTYSSTIGLSFIDQPKKMYHSKMQESAKNTEAFSIIYGATNGMAVFQEGTSAANVPETLKNQYTTSLSDEGAASIIETNDGAWHLYTMVMTNKSIKYYIDGVLQENENVNQGPRFFDGYYQRMQDTTDNNEVYGGAGNSGATSLLAFLTYEDTDMYLAYANVSKSNTQYQVCANAYFGEIVCYDEALSDEQVAKVYETQTEKYPEVSVVLGDVDGDTFVTAKDALSVLKHAAKLDVLEGNDFIAADVSKNEVVDSNDALLILKKAAGLISSFE